MLFACDDGDLEIETIDFNSVNVQTCDPISVETSNTMFKLNSTEALILELNSGIILNQVSNDSIPVEVSSAGPAKITYRTFSDDISNDYFCSDVPLATPTVIEEIIAEGGEVLVTTTLNEDQETYQHEIKIKTVSFITSNDSRITNLAVDIFGTVTTTLPE